MLNYQYRYESEKEDTCATHRDACEVCEEQRAYVFAWGLTKACAQLGK